MNYSHPEYQNPVDYMLDNLSSAYSCDGLNVYVAHKPIEVIPEKKRKRLPWYRNRLAAEKKRIEEAIKKRSDLIDELWERYK